MEQRSLLMKSSKFTDSDLVKKIKNWKDQIASGELQQVIAAKNQQNLSSLYKVQKKNSWVYKTILDNKIKYKLKDCKNLILVGSGLYPYSLLDMHKRFPDIKYHGIERSQKRAKLSELIINETPAKGSITIHCCMGEDFDYSFLADEDMVFISVDVNENKIVEKVIKTSRAQIYSCAPYKSSYVNGIFT